jgi:hemerythrin
VFARRSRRAAACWYPAVSPQGNEILSAPLLAWSEQLAIGQAVMDDTHREFVEQLNRVGEAADGAVLAALDDFIAHTQAHFGQEEAWMDAIEFPPRGCHRGEHDKVLETVREVRRRVEAGDFKLGRTLAEALAEWFPQHALSMDAILAMYMGQIGYIPGGDNAEVVAAAALAANAPDCAAGGDLCGHPDNKTDARET